MGNSCLAEEKRRLSAHTEAGGEGGRKSGAGPQHSSWRWTNSPREPSLGWRRLSKRVFPPPGGIPLGQEQMLLQETALGLRKCPF